MIAETSAPKKIRLPQSLGELFSLMVREIVKNFFKKIPTLVVTFIGSLLLHTFLMVYVNDGFGWSATLLADFLATRGNMLTSILIWSIIPSLVITNLRRIKELGLGEYISRANSSTKWIWDSCQNNNAFPKLLMAGAMIGLFPVSLARNSLLGLVLFAVFALEVVFRTESFWFFFLKLAWSDYQKYKKSNPPAPYDLPQAGILTVGLALGALVGFLLPGLRLYGLSGWVVIGIIFGSIYWYIAQKGSPIALLTVAVGFTLLTSFGLVSSALADDGGWTENGESFTIWIQSDGSIEAVTRGALPAGGGAVGIPIAIAIQNLMNGIGARAELADDVRKRISSVKNVGIGTTSNIGIGSSNVGIGDTVLIIEDDITPSLPVKKVRIGNQELSEDDQKCLLPTENVEIKAIPADSRYLPLVENTPKKIPDIKVNVFEFDLPKDKGKFDPSLGVKWIWLEGAYLKRSTEDGVDFLGGDTGVELGIGKDGITAGPYLDAYFFKGDWDRVFGNDQLGFTVEVAPELLTIESFGGVRHNAIDAFVKATLIALTEKMGVNIAGINVSLFGEIGLKGEWSRLGKPTKIYLWKTPFFSGGISIEPAESE